MNRLHTLSIPITLEKSEVALFRDHLSPSNMPSHLESVFRILTTATLSKLLAVTVHFVAIQKLERENDHGKHSCPTTSS
jgi:hypothetical protein